MLKHWVRSVIYAICWLSVLNALIALPIAYLPMAFGYPDVQECFEFGWCDMTLTAEECDDRISAWAIFFHHYFIIWLCFTSFSLLMLSVIYIIWLVLTWISERAFARKNT